MRFWTTALICIGLAAAGQANADVFDVAWSGAALGNDASATGTISMNLSEISSTGQTEQAFMPFVTNFSITVTGAGSGDGTFGFSDFNGMFGEVSYGGFYIMTGGSTLNFDTQLVGQPTPGGPWGSTHDGTTGDFNIFSNSDDPNAPTGTFYFEITTAGGRGDAMYLTSFAPASAVPEPSSAIPLSIALLELACLVRRRQA